MKRMMTIVALAACATLSCAQADDMIWGVLLHLGSNMWWDEPQDAKNATPYVWSRCAKDHVLCEEPVWREVTEAAAKGGLNMVVIDIGDALDFPSHPELRIKGGWSPEKLKAELMRLRGMGLEPIPKLNFSTCHDIWLKKYHRMVSTPEYYQVCRDVIRDVFDVFGKPRFFHLGFDEENDHPYQSYVVIRKGDLWWHDLRFFIDEVKKGGARPWIWADYMWKHQDRFLAEMPKDVLLSNWYYYKPFDLLALWNDKEHQTWFTELDAYGLIDMEGYDQVPTGSNWDNDANFSNTVAYCSRNIAKKNLKGFLQTPWAQTTEKNKSKILAAIDQAVVAKRMHETRPLPRVLPSRDFAADPAFVKSFHDAIVEKAKGKCFPAKPGLGLGAHIGTGGNFGGYFLWDTCFNVLWGAKEPKGTFPVLESMDNLYKLADAEGFVSRQYEPKGTPSWAAEHPISFAPPLMTWAEWGIFSSGCSDKARLADVYPKLARHHRACARKFRRNDGLYFGDWFGCGMDDLPRWPKDLDREQTIATGVKFTKETLNGNVRRWDGRVERHLHHYHWNRQAGWIDMSSQMALDALCLSRIAGMLDRADEAKAWRAEHAEIAAAINAKCWSEELGFYCDVGPNGILPRRHAGGFWVLLAEVATKERAAKVVKTLMDPNLFNRPTPFPTLPADDPDYGPDDPHSYSCGVVWPPTNYSLIKGLRAAGFEKEAEYAARKWFNACAELFTKYGTVMENMSPEQCGEKRARSQGDFCGWGALVPIALPREFGWLD